MGYKVRWGTKKVYKDKDTELPDFAFNHFYTAIGPEECEVGFLYPVEGEENKIKAAMSEITHHILGDYK